MWMPQTDEAPSPLSDRLLPAWAAIALNSVASGATLVARSRAAALLADRILASGRF
jgi:hypothetical protein